MRNLILHNWKAKLACLALAFVLWYLIRENVAREPNWRPDPSPWAQPGRS